jgi:hypothetical protein
LAMHHNGGKRTVQPVEGVINLKFFGNVEISHVAWLLLVKAMWSGLRSVFTHRRSLLLRLIAQTIGERNSETRNILDNTLVGILFRLIF